MAAVESRGFCCCCSCRCLFLPDWSAACEPNERDLEVGQQVLESFGPLVTNVEPQPDGVPADLVALYLVWKLEVRLGLVGYVVLLGVNGKLVQTLEEHTHRLVVVGSKKLSHWAVELVRVFSIGYFRIGAHWDQLVLRELKLVARRRHGVQQQHRLAPSRVDLVPLHLNLVRLSHPEAVDRTKRAVMPDVKDVVVDIRSLQKLQLGAGAFYFVHESALLLAIRVQLQLVVVELSPVMLLELIKLFRLLVEPLPFLIQLFQLLLQLCNLLVLLPLLLLALGNLPLKLLVSKIIRRRGTLGRGRRRTAGRCCFLLPALFLHLAESELIRLAVQLALGYHSLHLLLKQQGALSAQVLLFSSGSEIVAQAFRFGFRDVNQILETVKQLLHVIQLVDMVVSAHVDDLAYRRSVITSMPLLEV
mmetsp:Transcript_6999/g.12848  ORF Transcript_6999/g.12848 Transcript_6999/m.12848 type:complete len:417 (-) Transcript_6999:199-1449(-)